MNWPNAINLSYSSQISLFAGGTQMKNRLRGAIAVAMPKFFERLNWFELTFCRLEEGSSPASRR